jgi:hypothetical protein
MTFKEWLELREAQSRIGGNMQRQYLPSVPFGKEFDDEAGVNPLTTLAKNIGAIGLTAIGQNYRKSLGALANYGQPAFPDIPKFGEQIGVVFVYYPDPKYVDPKTGEQDLTDELSGLTKRVENGERLLRQGRIESRELATRQNELDRVKKYRRNQLINRAVAKAKSEPNADKLDLHNPQVIKDYFDGKTLGINVKFNPIRGPKIKDI